MFPYKDNDFSCAKAIWQAVSLKGKQLKISVLWCAGKRNNITEMGHSGYKQNKAFEAKANPLWGSRSKLTCFEVPPRDLSWVNSVP
jgi:hypothetical protein